MSQLTAKQQVLNQIALLCIQNQLSSSDLGAIAHQLAQFDTICDHRTQGNSDVACH